MVGRPKGCPKSEYKVIREWFDELLKESRKSAKEAEKAFLEHWEDRAETAPREHIAQKKWGQSGIVSSLHRGVWVLIRSREFSNAEVAGLLGINIKTLSNIKRILKDSGF